MSFLLPDNCQQQDPWDYGTSAEFIDCRYKLAKISAIIIAVIVVILVVVLWFVYDNKLVPLAVLAGGGFIVAGTMLLAKWSARRTYGNMTRELVNRMRTVDGFDASQFEGMNVNRDDIVKAGNKADAESSGNEFDEAYEKFLTDMREDKKARMLAEAYRRR